MEDYRKESAIYPFSDSTSSEDTDYFDSENPDFSSPIKKLNLSLLISPPIKVMGLLLRNILSFVAFFKEKNAMSEMQDRIFSAQTQLFINRIFFLIYDSPNGTTYLYVPYLMAQFFLSLPKKARLSGEGLSPLECYTSELLALKMKLDSVWEGVPTEIPDDDQGMFINLDVLLEFDPNMKALAECNPDLFSGLRVTKKNMPLQEAALSHPVFLHYILDLLREKDQDGNEKIGETLLAEIIELNFGENFLHQLNQSKNPPEVRREACRAVLSVIPSIFSLFNNELRIFHSPEEENFGLTPLAFISEEEREKNINFYYPESKDEAKKNTDEGAFFEEDILLEESSQEEESQKTSLNETSIQFVITEEFEEIKKELRNTTANFLGNLSDKKERKNYKPKLREILRRISFEITQTEEGELGRDCLKNYKGFLVSPDCEKTVKTTVKFLTNIIGFVRRDDQFSQYKNFSLYSSVSVERQLRQKEFHIAALKFFTYGLELFLEVGYSIKVKGYIDEGEPKIFNILKVLVEELAIVSGVIQGMDMADFKRFHFLLSCLFFIMIPIVMNYFFPAILYSNSFFRTPRKAKAVIINHILGFVAQLIDTVTCIRLKLLPQEDECSLTLNAIFGIPVERKGDDEDTVCVLMGIENLLSPIVIDELLFSIRFFWSATEPSVRHNWCLAVKALFCDSNAAIISAGYPLFANTYDGTLFDGILNRFKNWVIKLEKVSNIKERLAMCESMFIIEDSIKKVPEIMNQFVYFWTCPRKKDFEHYLSCCGHLIDMQETLGEFIRSNKIDIKFKTIQEKVKNQEERRKSTTDVWQDWKKNSNEPEILFIKRKTKKPTAKKIPITDENSSILVDNTDVFFFLKFGKYLFKNPKKNPRREEVIFLLDAGPYFVFVTDISNEISHCLYLEEEPTETQYITTKKLEKKIIYPVFDENRKCMWRLFVYYPSSRYSDPFYCVMVYPNYSFDQLYNEMPVKTLVKTFEVDQGDRLEITDIRQYGNKSNCISFPHLVITIFFSPDFEEVNELCDSNVIWRDNILKEIGERDLFYFYLDFFSTNYEIARKNKGENPQFFDRFILWSQKMYKLNLFFFFPYCKGHEISIETFFESIACAKIKALSSDLNFEENLEHKYEVKWDVIPFLEKLYAETERMVTLSFIYYYCFINTLIFLMLNLPNRGDLDLFALAFKHLEEIFSALKMLRDEDKAIIQKTWAYFMIVDMNENIRGILEFVNEPNFGENMEAIKYGSSIKKTLEEFNEYPDENNYVFLFKQLKRIFLLPESEESRRNIVKQNLKFLYRYPGASISFVNPEINRDSKSNLYYYYLSPPAYFMENVQHYFPDAYPEYPENFLSLYSTENAQNHPLNTYPYYPDSQGYGSIRSLPDPREPEKVITKNNRESQPKKSTLNERKNKNPDSLCLEGKKQKSKKQASFQYYDTSHRPYNKRNNPRAWKKKYSNEVKESKKVLKIPRGQVPLTLSEYYEKEKGQKFHNLESPFGKTRPWHKKPRGTKEFTGKSNDSSSKSASANNQKKPYTYEESGNRRRNFQPLQYKTRSNKTYRSESSGRTKNLPQTTSYKRTNVNNNSFDRPSSGKKKQKNRGRLSYEETAVYKLSNRGEKPVANTNNANKRNKTAPSTETSKLASRVEKTGANRSEKHPKGLDNQQKNGGRDGRTRRKKYRLKNPPKERKGKGVVSDTLSWADRLMQTPQTAQVSVNEQLPENEGRDGRTRRKKYRLKNPSKERKGKGVVSDTLSWADRLMQTPQTATDENDKADMEDKMYNDVPLNILKNEQDISGSTNEDEETSIDLSLFLGKKDVDWADESSSDDGLTNALSPSPYGSFFSNPLLPKETKDDRNTERFTLN